MYLYGTVSQKGWGVAHGSPLPAPSRCTCADSGQPKAKRAKQRPPLTSFGGWGAVCTLPDPEVTLLGLFLGHICRTGQGPAGRRAGGRAQNQHRVFRSAGPLGSGADGLFRDGTAAWYGLRKSRGRFCLPRIFDLGACFYFL